MELWEDLSSELWQVQRGLGEARLMTLDELDTAYKQDEIGDHTLVRKAGSDGWRTLGAIAGIEPSSAMLESESLVPVASEILLPPIPGPPRLPTRLEASGVDALVPEAPLTERELATARPRRITETIAKASLLLAAAGIVYAGTSTFLTKAYGPVRMADTVVTNAVRAPSYAAPVDEDKPVLEEGSMVVLARASDTESAPRVINASPVVLVTSAAPAKLAVRAKTAPLAKVAPITVLPKVAPPRALPAAPPAKAAPKAMPATPPAPSPFGLHTAPPAPAPKRR